MTSLSTQVVETQTPDFHDAWIAALEAMELDLDRAEELLKSNAIEVPDLLPWIPPTGIGALPLTLIERARVLHERQLQVAVELGAAIAGNRRQAEFADAIDATRPQARPVFIDRAC